MGLMMSFSNLRMRRAGGQCTQSVFTEMSSCISRPGFVFCVWGFRPCCIDGSCEASLVPRVLCHRRLRKKYKCMCDLAGIATFSPMRESEVQTCI